MAVTNIVCCTLILSLSGIMNRYQKLGLLFKCARLARQFSVAKKSELNYYEILGISQKANDAEIRSAYFQKSKLYHPDVAEPTEENLNRFRKISEAYETLGSPLLRKEYDERVLGITTEYAEDSSLNDPIATYKQQRTRYDSNSSWTREHYSTLRKKQYVEYSAKKRRDAEKSTEKHNDNFLFFVIMIFAVLSGIRILGITAGEKGKIF